MLKKSRVKGYRKRFEERARVFSKLLGSAPLSLNGKLKRRRKVKTASLLYIPMSLSVVVFVFVFVCVCVCVVRLG